ncbi:holin [Sporosarcina phage Lietuvens]|nr:holin [Sporosarcina phage Lietuvens]
MRINFKIRGKNPQFWLNLALSVVVPIGAYFGITGADLTTWGAVWDITVKAVSNPFVLFTMASGAYSALIDPTTPGLSDSGRALRYKKPGGGARG